ncbi:MAG: pilus assembly protein PilM, partial [Planctomycetes bacterium]|nr:pilus assembly protein PilM [Planctomycetota bacterium]
MRVLSAKRFSPIGLDIGTGAIKMAQLEQIGERSRVVALAQYELSVASDAPEERLEAIRLGISNLVRRGIFQGRDLVLTLNSQQLFVQNIRLPQIAPEELEKVVRWEAEERLPDDFGDAEVRHLMAGEVRTGTGAGEGAESRHEVILLACRRKELNELIELLESQRLRPLAADIQACALVRASQASLRRKSDEQTGLLFLDVGCGMTKAVVTRGQEILLIKPLPMGGRSMDRLVARRLNLSPEDAAVIRRQWMDGETDGADPELSRAVGEAVRSEIESLANELLMCIRYHNVTF